MFLDYQTGDYVITEDELKCQSPYDKVWKQTSNQTCTYCNTNNHLVCNMNTMSTSYPEKYECRCISCGKISYRLKSEVKFK